MNSPDPKSNRSKRRANRKESFVGSRCNKRAQSRLDVRLQQFDKMVSMSGGSGPFTKPGSMRHW